MDYKLFDDYITLQALLKELSIIQSGGAIKAFLADHAVYFNGKLENRRGKKLRLGDRIDIPELAIEITLIEPSKEERTAHQEELEEKARVAALVKKLNQEQKKSKAKTKPIPQKKADKTVRKPVRFPGT